MYSPFQLAIKYLKYYFTAANGKGHGVHSPFVFDFITKVMNDKRRFYSYVSIESMRSDLRLDRRILKIDDYGAGSVVNKSKKRTVKDIARSCLKPKKYAQLMFRMVDYYRL